MCDWAATNLSMGYNVLYITMEMSEEEISKRIDGNLLDVELDDLEHMDLAVLKKKADKVREKARSSSSSKNSQLHLHTPTTLDTFLMSSAQEELQTGYHLCRLP
jgi:reverse gyrase